METSDREKSRRNKRKKKKYVSAYLGRHSKLCPENKLLIYKIIIKPIWTYGIDY